MDKRKVGKEESCSYETNNQKIIKVSVNDASSLISVIEEHCLFLSTRAYPYLHDALYRICTVHLKDVRKQKCGKTAAERVSTFMGVPNMEVPGSCFRILIFYSSFSRQEWNIGYV